MNEIYMPRFHLRQFTPGDLGDLYPIFSDPDVVKYMKTGEPVSPEETERALTSIIRHWKTHGFGRWAVIYKETGKLIGYGGLRSLDGMPELVYLLAKRYWNMGLATEIAKVSLKWGFEQQHFERIMAVTKPENLASRRVMEKAGMVYEKEGNYYGIDIVQYTISRAAHESLSVLDKLTWTCMADSNSRSRPTEHRISTEA